MFAFCLVQEEMVKTGFCHKNVCKQENMFLLVEKGTTPTNHKIIWQTTWFGCWGTGGSCGRDGGKRVTATVMVTESNKDREFWELRKLWHLAGLKCIVSVLCSVGCSVLVCSWVIFCLMSQNNEETAECWAGRNELRRFKCKYLHITL